MINVIYNNDIYLDPIVTSITWSGEIATAFRTLSVSIKNTIDGETQAVSIELGRELRFETDGAELFRGVIFKHEINAKGDMTITAYDEAVYLTKNADTKKFSGLTASAIVRQLAADFGIATGQITDTGYVIPKLILRDMTIWDMITTALTETRKQTGKRFLLSSSAGAINLSARGEKVADFILDDMSNLTDARYSQSIDDMRNQVKVTGGDEEKAPLSATTRDSALIDRFGIMQHLENADSDLNQSQIEQLAAKLLDDLGKINDEASVEVLGNVEVTSGTAVYVKDSLTNIVGAFYVITDSHTFSNGIHRMSLTISGDESLPKLEYEPPDNETKAATKKKGAKEDAFDRIINSKGIGD